MHMTLKKAGSVMFLLAAAFGLIYFSLIASGTLPFPA